MKKLINGEMVTVCCKEGSDDPEDDDGPQAIEIETDGTKNSPC